MNRLRRNFEKLINFKLISLFANIGKKSSDAFLQNGQRGFQIYSQSILRDVERTLAPIYSSITTSFAQRTLEKRISKKEIVDFENIYRQFMMTYGGLRITNISDTTRNIILAVILEFSDAGV